MVNWRMESTFVITYLMVRISVNSVKYRQQMEQLTLFSPVGRGLFVYRTGVVLYGGLSDDRTD
jgi:hypothetical protein